MNKKGFFGGLFKKKDKDVTKEEKGKESKDKNIKVYKEDPSKEKKVVEEITEKPVPFPKDMKDVEKEEMKIAQKEAGEFLKTHPEETENVHPEKIAGKKVKTLKANEKISIGKTKSGDGVSSGGEEVIKFNVEGFNDLLLHGGIPVGSSILVEGGPGSGKTIFCLHLANDMCARGKNVLYMSFEEPEERLVSHMESFGFPASKYVKNGTLNIMRFNALDIARSVEALLSEAKKELLIDVQPILIPQEIDPDLVLVDSLTSIASAFSGEESRFRIYMEQLFRYLEEHKMTSFLIREVPNPGHVGKNVTMADEATSFLSDGIIIFYNVIFGTGNRTRAMEILKLRGQQFERKIVEVEIKDTQGMIIHAGKTLTGKYELT
jgi:KaiC/GvpD/RAD55 family RecA-like ATPase